MYQGMTSKLIKRTAVWLRYYTTIPDSNCSFCFPIVIVSLMEIKGFSKCIAANKQQACGLAAAASCGMVAACEFLVCKLVLLLLVAATLRLLVAAALRLLVAATLWPLVAATLRLIVCCNLAACAFFVCKLDFLLLVAACLLQTVAACLLQTAAACFTATDCEYPLA